MVRIVDQSAAAAPSSGLRRVFDLVMAALMILGAALLIPPVHILTTLLFTELTSRARAVGVVSALGGIDAAVR
jgi:hypothetical protein